MKYPLGEELRLGGGSGDGADAAVELKGKKKERKDRLLRERREEAKRVCEAGLADPYTHLSACPASSALDLAATDAQHGNSLQIVPTAPHCAHRVGSLGPDRRPHDV